MIPFQPIGAKGVKLLRLTCLMPRIIKRTITDILITTIILLVTELSLIPINKIQVMSIVMRTAGRSMIPPARGVRHKALGSLTPRLSMSPMKVDDQPEATALAETKYSSIRSHPMIQAIISPKAA